MRVQKIELSQIKVRDRYRKEMGNLDSLKESMERLGLLQPVIVRGDGRLVAGARRIAAAKELGWEEIDAYVATAFDDVMKFLTAERDENTERKPFTVFEAVSLGTELEELEAKEAKQRQAQAGPAEGKGKKESGAGKLPDAVKGDTRDKVGGAVGMSGTQWRKAKKVVAAIEAAPTKWKDVKEELEETGKVDPAYRRIFRKPAARKHPTAGNLADAVGQLWVLTKAVQKMPRDGSEHPVIAALAGKKKLAGDVAGQLEELSSWLGALAERVGKEVERQGREAKA